AAVLSPLAYILVLIALSFTAVSAIAPAREVSVLFGVLLGRRMLGEQGMARRLAAAAAIVAGIIPGAGGWTELSCPRGSCGPGGVDLPADQVAGFARDGRLGPSISPNDLRTT